MRFYIYDFLFHNSNFFLDYDYILQLGLYITQLCFFLFHNYLIIATLFLAIYTLYLIMSFLL